MLERSITVFPTYGYRDAAESASWVIRVRVWVHKGRHLPFPDELVRILLEEMGALRETEILALRTRLADFIADDDSLEQVEFRFAGDVDNETFRFAKRTDFNGLVEQEFRIPVKKIERLLERDEKGSGWLTVVARCKGAEAAGRMRLIEPEGLSVISDVDDTIKITEIPAGPAIVMRNTFLRPYKVVPGMLENYRAFGTDTSFHYVSGGPWQMFNLIHSFLIVESGFPAGSFHMKDLRKNLLVPDSWRDLSAFLKGDLATIEQKTAQITRLMVNLPNRRFVLVGDSGEKDPEIFDQIRRTFPEQVKEIIIRDVVNERNRVESVRLQGMTIIEAPTITRGISGLTD
jgi:phosphatidate phosphatase APP1